MISNYFLHYDRVFFFKDTAPTEIYTYCHTLSQPDALPILERINRLLALHQEPRYPHEQDPFTGRRGVAVELDRVCFRYGSGEPVLNDVSLTIGAGERVALVGASGGGKSTLVQVDRKSTRLNPVTNAHLVCRLLLEKK